MIFLSLLTFLVSCATKKDLSTKISDLSWDGFSDESYARWDEQRLAKTLSSDKTISKCHLGKTSEALKDYRQQYLTKDKNPFYWLHIGNCFSLQQNFNQAEFFYRLTIEETKFSSVQALAQNNLGDIYLKYAQWEKARDAFKKAIELNPKARVPKFNLAQVYLQFGQTNKALRLLQDDSFKKIQDIGLFHSLALAWLAKGNISKADEYIKKIPEQFHSRDDIALTATLYHLKKGEFKEAETFLKNRTQASNPESNQIAKRIEALLEKRARK